jgi:hypothetical protein
MESTRRTKTLAERAIVITISVLLFLFALSSLGVVRSRDLQFMPFVSGLRTQAPLDSSSSYPADTHACRQTENQIDNPGFEDDLAHWRKGDDDCSYKVSPDAAKTGTHAVRMIAVEPEEECTLYTYAREITAQPHAIYEYAVWTKTNSDFDGEALVYVEFFDADFRLIDEDRSKHIRGPQTTWHEMHGFAQAPENAEYARLGVAIRPESSGWVWFDDAFLGRSTCIEISKQTAQYAIAPGDLLTYTITYINRGEESATGVQIIESYHSVSYVQSDPTPMAGTTDHWFQPLLFPRESRSITLVVRADQTLTECLPNKVQVFSYETSLNPQVTRTCTAVKPNSPKLTYLPIAARRYWDCPNEEEDDDRNNSCKRNEVDGPLCPGIEYRGTREDMWDCYELVTDRPGLIVIDLKDQAEADVELLLYQYPKSEAIARDTKPPFHIEYLGTQEARYCVTVYTPSGHNDSSYTLKSQFPREE